MQVRSVIVTEILELETEGSQPPPVAADGTWLVILAILLSGRFFVFLKLSDVHMSPVKIHCESISAVQGPC